MIAQLLIKRYSIMIYAEKMKRMSGVVYGKQAKLKALAGKRGKTGCTLPTYVIIKQRELDCGFAV